MRMKPLQLMAVIAAVAYSALGAQNAAPPRSTTGKARIVGIVVDSLNGGPLAHADILIDGAAQSTENDSLGKFEFDSLTPGNFQLGVFHPVLDTLGVSIATRPFHAGPDSTTIVVMAIPSAATLVHQKCGAVSGETGMSAIIGQVKDPDDLKAIVGAEVSIAWNDIEVSKQIGIRQTPHLVTGTTDKNGEFKFCGLPSSLQATLKARRGAAATAEIPIGLGDGPVELTARTVLLSAADSMAKTGSGAVSGVVLLADGAPSAGSRVELVGTDIVTMTDAKGEFALRNLPSGSRGLLARHLGYAAQTASVDLSSRAQLRVTIKLPKYVAVMDPVLVTARRTAALEKVGFGERRKSANGYFLGPDQIARMHPYYVTDLLRSVPGLQVVHTATGEAVRSMHDMGRQTCVQYFLDGMSFTEMVPGDANAFVNGDEIAGVEVYQAGMAPAEYSRALNSCLTILLWTRFKAGS